MENQPNFNKVAIRLICQKMEERGWNQTQLGQRLNMKPSSIHRLVNANTIMVEKLKQLSLVFNYNFFKVLADQLDLPEPKKVVIDPAEHAECLERIRELEIENRTLLKVLKAED